MRAREVGAGEVTAQVCAAACVGESEQGSWTQRSDLLLTGQGGEWLSQALTALRWVPRAGEERARLLRGRRGGKAVVMRVGACTAPAILGHRTCLIRAPHLLASLLGHCTCGLQRHLDMRSKARLRLLAGGAV